MAVPQNLMRRLRVPALPRTAISHATSWVFFTLFLAAGLRYIPSEIVGGTYSNIDGQWLAWNASSIFNYANFLDPSPYNAFSGMGSMYLPNLPWLNPGALALKLPLSLRGLYVVSYVIYLLLLAGSIALLAKSLGLSWTVATLSAQLHILVLFPPFSYFFRPMEWYSAAPIYAQITVILNLAMAVFLGLGRWRDSWSLAGSVIGLPMLAVIGVLSAPFSFIFFLAPYVALAIAVLAVMRPTRRELLWKVVGIACVVAVVTAAGFPDYLRAMAETSARTTRGAVDWGSLGSPTAWYNLLSGHSLCADPRALICQGNPVRWLQIGALLGGIVLSITGSGLNRALGLWTIGYTAAVHLHPYLYVTGWLGQLGFVATHFLSWSSYAILVMPIIAAPPVLLSRIRGLAGPDLKISLSNHGSMLWGARVSTLALFLLPVVSLCLLLFLKEAKQPMRVASSGPILEHLDAKGRLALDGVFNGYTATVWSSGVDAVDPHQLAKTTPIYRYIGARFYFEKHYGNTFTEMDLWTRGIPTFEEYGQWISRQAQTFALTVLAEERARVLREPRLLRIFKRDANVMRALGIRFMITDEAIERDERFVRLASQSAPGALTVHLYELVDANLATFSPTEPVRVAHDAAAILSAVSENSAVLDRKVFVTLPLEGSFVPIDSSSMRLMRDGYRILAQSKGRSLLLLPIQYSRCLKVVNRSPGRVSPQVIRANFIQTAVLFDLVLDAQIEFDFGLFGKASCRLEDAAELAALMSPVAR
jgi:hypothetical protein